MDVIALHLVRGLQVVDGSQGIAELSLECGFGERQIVKAFARTAKVNAQAGIAALDQTGGRAGEHTFGDMVGLQLIPRSGEPVQHQHHGGRIAVWQRQRADDRLAV